jgi:hypothetical protein
VSAGSNSGYRCWITAGNPINGVTTSYAVGAAPLAYNNTGVRLFCMTSEDSQIRADSNIGASTTPPSPTSCVSGQFSPM